jgi:hypothetical protein
MDNLFRGKMSDTQQPGRFLSRLQQIVKIIINRLMSVFELTNEDKEKAGIYPGEGRD